jgi:hypothetical protein
MQRPDRSAHSPPKRPRQAGTLASLRLTVWHALRHAEHIMVTSGDAAMRLRAVHAITQASMAYCKLHEVIDLHHRVEALEELLTGRNHHDL